MPEAGAYGDAERAGQLTGPGTAADLVITRMDARERLSQSYEITVDVLSKDEAVNLHTELGKEFTVKFTGDPAMSRVFRGLLWGYSELGRDDMGWRYQLELRPAPHLLYLNRDSRVFQTKTRIAIVKEVLGSDKLNDQLTASYDTLDYIVQYQESDMAFASRLMEVEGVYYHYKHGEGETKLVLVDDRQSHTELPGGPFRVVPGGAVAADEAYFKSVSEHRGLAAAKSESNDYDYAAPAANLRKPATAAKPAGEHASFNSGGDGSISGRVELYDYPGGYTQATLASGERYAKRLLYSDRREMSRAYATGTVFAAAAGSTISLKPEDTEAAEFLIVAARHRYVAAEFRSGGASLGDELVVDVELMPAAEQFRPPLSTPKPRLVGPQTAVVVGPAGQEIHTDEERRIKIQFHWDRLGPKTDASSCWVRVAQWIAGQGWGALHLPRIGMEVIVDFIEGDPDKPLVTGCVYNAINTPPSTPIDMKEVQGLKTRSSMGGDGWSGWVIDDKAGSELYHMRAEKNLVTHVVKGNETRRIIAGYRNTKVHVSDTLLVEEADLKTTVAKGNEIREITKGTRTTTIEGDETLTIKTGNRLDTIETGNDTLAIKMGNREATIDMGNDTLTVKMGNVVTSVKMGSHKTDAMQAIELKCGGSTIKMTPMSIEIKSMMIKIDATMMLETKGLMIQQQASVMHIVKGGIVMIN